MSKENDEKSALVPRLRFPEFDGIVSALPLAAVADFVSEKISVDQLTSAQYVSTENLLPDFGGMNSAAKLPSVSSVTSFKPNDVLVSNIRPYLRKVWQANICGGASNDVLVVRSTERIAADYLAAILRSDLFIDYVMRGAKGVKMPRGEISMIEEFPVPCPSADEQQKIADCLSSLDELITAETQKLDGLKTHKKGLMQQLFPREGETVPRLRFPEFREAGEWSGMELGGFINERTQPSSDGEPLFSLTIEDGVTPKTERYERSFLVNDESDAYKLMRPDDFAYNPMNLRFGAIGRHKGSANVAVSKYYNIFHCDQSVNTKFCEIYFKSDQMVAFYDRVAIGSLIEKRRVHFSDFLKFVIPFPRLDEQQGIADCLSSLDDLIAAQSQKIGALKTHKKGLMQQLFPVLDEVQA